ncbi:serine/threonine protein kinase [Microseira wollei]|uniref:non-specific serine/threonine protein kinase n=1 Tax=Microseira wollei NIES-4236 TaxID=2530354 RepID=A0AAV3XTE9_9CYAN|nr:serine/threonine-protein kinase [Microseira wollei]GET43945.1 serine/threonine protein kinase [Microseira wollei NIES-4236]
MEQLEGCSRTAQTLWCKIVKQLNKCINQQVAITASITNSIKAIMEFLHKSGDIIAEKYRIKSTLGQGGIGITYQAIDLQNNNLVAIKTLSLRRMTDWKALELFERESKILSQLHHPGIPQYLDYFQVEIENDRSFYLVQQLAEGTSLANWIENGWRPQESEVKDIAIQVLKILAYLQTLTPPIIHRDIKPQNIIMRSPQPPEPRGASEPPLLRGAWGDLFLVDFGAVQDVYHQTVTGGSTVVGTYGYMAPEQFRGQAVLSTDLYGLGTTLLFLLTQKSPADLPQRRLKINFRSHLRVDKKFANWLERMIEPEIENRFDSAQEALAVLQNERAAKSKSLTPRKPKHSPIILTRTEERLLIEIPPVGLRTNQSKLLIFLSLIWNGISCLILWIIRDFHKASAINLENPLAWIFLVIFWSIGILLWRDSLLVSLCHIKLEMNPESFRIQQSSPIWLFKQVEEFRSDIKQLTVKTGWFNQITMCVSKARYRFGLFLTQAEKKWLVWEMRSFLEKLRS